MFTKLLGLVNDFSEGYNLHYTTDGNKTYFTVNDDMKLSEMLESLNDLMRYSWSLQIDEIQLGERQLTSLIQLLGEKPFIIQTVVLKLRNAESVEAFVYLEGQKSDRIERKWSNKIHNTLGIPCILNWIRTGRS